MLYSFTIVAERLERFLEHEKTGPSSDTENSCWCFVQVSLTVYASKVLQSEGPYKAHHLPDNFWLASKHLFRMLSDASCLSPGRVHHPPHWEFVLMSHLRFPPGPGTALCCSCTSWYWFQESCIEQQGHVLAYFSPDQTNPGGLSLFSLDMLPVLPALLPSEHF